MRLFSAFFLLLSGFTQIRAQVFVKTNEIIITEKQIGKIGFHFTDNDHNGQFEFIADANNGAGIFSGEIVNHEIKTYQYRKFTNVSNDFLDLRLEDTNLDGHKELYALYESAGLFILDTISLAPLDTIEDFPVSVLFRKIVLADIDHDLTQEWVLLDGSDGITVLELPSFTPVWNAPDLKGTDFVLGNLDEDNALELVLKTSTNIKIINIETLEEEHLIPVSTYDEMELADLNQDGIDELVLIDGAVLQLYDHISMSIFDSFSTGSTVFNDRFYTNLDEDPALEIVLYQPNFNTFREINTYPLTQIEQFSLPSGTSPGWYVGPVPGAPDTLVFLPAEGIIQMDYPNKLTQKTKITGAMAGKLSARFDFLPNEVLITHSSESYENFLSFRDLISNHSIKQVKETDLFEGHIAQFAETIDPIHFRGRTPEMLLINNGRNFTLYDPADNSHTDYFDLQGNHHHLSDLDYDGNDELLNTLNNQIHVYRQSNFRQFQYQCSTPATELFTLFRTGQLDDTPEKEIISYNFQKILVHNSKDGSLLRDITAIPLAVIQDVTTFTDSTGNFFIGVMHSGKYYIYNYTKDILVKTFNFAGSTVGFSHILQVIEGGLLHTYILIHSDRFQVFTTAGTPVFIENLADGSRQAAGKIILTDYNNDQKPDILLSSLSKLSIYSYEGSGIPVSSFYLTSAYPDNFVHVPYASSFFLQFSEPVAPESIHGNVAIKAQTQGELDYTVEWINDMMIKITHEPLQAGKDTITLTLSGELQSKSMRYFDSEYDGISYLDQEPPRSAAYIYDPGSPVNTVNLTLTSPLPEAFYAGSKRHLAIRVSSAPETPVPIANMRYGMVSGGIPNIQSLLPLDELMDEAVEDFLLPVSTAELSTGMHLLFIVAGDAGGQWSDTLFIPLEVIEESGYYDKNEGGGATRTQTIENSRVSSSFQLTHTAFHTTSERLSHIVGGDGVVYYLIRHTSDRTLTLRKATFPEFSIIWEHTFDTYMYKNSIHLSDGVLYFINQSSQNSEFRVFAYDAISGFEIWNQQIYLGRNFSASPITDRDHLLITGGEYGGTYCFDRWTGKQKWYSKRENNHSEEGVPAIYNISAYLVEHTTVKSIDLVTGEPQWEITVNEEEPYLLVRNALVDTLHQQLIWPGKNNLYAFDLETGAQKWRKPGSNSIKNPVQFENLIFLFKANAVQKLNATTGSVIQTKTLTTEIEAQPVGANGKIFLPLEDSLIVMDMYSLATLWSVPLKAREISIIDQYLLVTDNLQKVYVYKSVDGCCHPAIEWTEAEFYGHLGGAMTRIYTYDTVPVIQNGNVYFEILASNLEQGGNWEKTNLLIRESEDKIYVWLDTREEVIADYSLELHETITLFTGVELMVVNIDTIQLVTGESRKRLELHCNNWPPIYWIKGIGSTSGLVLTPETCFADVGGALLCHFVDGQLLYDNPDYNTCWLQLVATDELAAFNIRFYPNPVHDLLTVEDPDNTISNIMLYNTDGQLVYSGVNPEVNTSHLLPGCYQLCMVLKTGIMIYKRVIKL